MVVRVWGAMTSSPFSPQQLIRSNVVYGGGRARMYLLAGCRLDNDVMRLLSIVIQSLPIMNN